MFSNHEPEISVILPTYNEVQVIRQRLNNLKDQNYPQEKFSIIVVDSASTDGTERMVRDWMAENSSPEVFLLVESKRSGKISAINYAIKHVPKTVETVVLTDADCIWKQDALKNAAKYFSNDSVGAVTCNIHPYEAIRASEKQVDNIEMEYRRLDNKVRITESKICSTPIVHGPFLAIRKDLLDKIGGIPTWSGADDSTPASIISLLGYRVLAAPDVVVFEYIPSSIKSQILRRVRRAQHLIQTFSRTEERVGQFDTRPSKQFKSIFRVEKFLHTANPWILVLASFFLIPVLIFRPWMGIIPLAFLSFGMLFSKLLRLWLLTQLILLYSSVKNQYSQNTMWIPLRDFDAHPKLVNDIAKKVRVLLVSREYPPTLTGGISRRLSRIVPNLVRNNIDLEVVCFGGSSMNGEVVHSLKPRSPILLQRTPKISVKSAPSILIDIWRLNRHASRLLASRDYDVVQIEEPVFAPFINTGGVPKVVTVHTTQLGEARTLLSSKGIRQSLTRILFSGSVGWVMDLFGLRKSKVVIAAGDLIRDELVTYYRTPPSKIHVVTNSIEAPTKLRKDSAKKKIGVENILIVYVGRLVLRKHVDDFIKAIYRLTQKGAEDINVLIVGTGPQMQRLTHLVDELDLKKYILFKGFVEDDELFTILEAADIFVLPSSYESGVPLAVLEAMAYGCLPIVADIPSVKRSNVVRPNQNTLMFQTGEVESLSDILWETITNESLRSTISARARQAVLHLSWDAATKRYIQIYNRVASKTSEQLIGERIR